MHALSFTLVDLLVVVTVIVSTGLAIWRGFIRETLSIFAWAAAAFATLYFGPYAAALLRARFSTPWVGALIGYAGTFLLVLMPLSFISYRFSEGVRGSPVGTVDRSLGSAFGVVRGLAVVGIAYIVLSLMVSPAAQPDWIGKARLLPVIQGSADVVLSLLPARDQPNIAPVAAAAETKIADAPVPRPRPAVAKVHRAKAYDAGERRALDQLIQSTAGPGNK